MSQVRYRWRQLTAEGKAELLAWRKRQGRPWHSPPHWANGGHSFFHITAACYEHRQYIGHSSERMEAFAADLLAVFATGGCRTIAWCVLPNHYHGLVETPDVLGLLHGLGQLHGRTSYAWNGEEMLRGRKVFYRAVERAMRSEQHYWATLNYVQHNPVHHGYVEKWTDWPWSSAQYYLMQIGRDEAQRIWGQYPVLDYGRGWDEREM